MIHNDDLRSPKTCTSVRRANCRSSGYFSWCWVFCGIVAIGLGFPGTNLRVVAQDKVLVSIQEIEPGKGVKTQQGAEMEVIRDNEQPLLRVSTGHASDWPGIVVAAPEGHWDLSTFRDVVLEATNLGSESFTLNCRMDCPGGDGQKNSVTSHVQLKPNETKKITVSLRGTLPEAIREDLFGMRGYPAGYSKTDGLDASQITQFIIFAAKPKIDHVFSIGDIRACGERHPAKWLTMSKDEFFPMIDKYGQFMHKQWPGKTTSDESLRASIESDRKDLDSHPAPEQWDKFGGWKDGPQLAATGFFRTQQRDGKWWLVDPEGRLFWSHGTDCVGFHYGTTPISDREFYFDQLPDKESPFAEFYGHGSWAPHGYYKKGRYRSFSFSAANLMRKYGPDWRKKASQVVHRRLRSWSMNTIANWSDANIYRMRTTPYVVSAGTSGAKLIEGSSGYWGKFPDPFDPSFTAALNRRMTGEKDRSANDPWCIGYFVDNELGWGDELSLAKAALSSPKEQASKQEFIKDLKTKYVTIESLNKAWGVKHESWAALAECTEAPDEKRAKEDLGAFYTRIAEEYFRNCRDAVKHVAPDNLYLGCRFAWVNDRGARAAAKYCDVIGYNLYRDSVTDFKLPDGVDMPVIIGEFHFGALDRGMFHTGLRPTASQQDRAKAYRDYVTGAMKNPFFVGSHWFQYSDQATTGRGDGENYQIGLVDICDRPYPETIQAVRQVGNQMYQIRSGKGE